jgi:hypothetical protein
MHDILVDASGKIISANVSEKGRHGQ